MKHPVSWRTIRALALLVAGISGIFWHPSLAVAQQLQPVANASAYGTFVQIEDTIVSQKTAPVGVACGLSPRTKTKDLAGLDVAGLVDVGNIETTAKRNIWNDGSVIAKAISEIENINLLGGLVGASAVKAVSTTRSTESGFVVNAAGTQFANLEVAGISIPIDIPPNTQVDIPLVGHISINERDSFMGTNRANHRTTMLRVVVTLPILFEVGTEVVVGNAQTSMFNTLLLFGGYAYSTSVEVGDLAVLDPSFRKGLGCSGTNGQWRSNGGLLVGLPGILGSATALNRVRADTTPTGGFATATSEIEGVDVLAGLVTADVIFGRAHTRREGGELIRRIWGSKFLGLSVAGSPEITDDIPKNTHLNIVGVGDLWLKREVLGQNSTEVRMVELTVLDDTILPVGAVVRVGVSKTKVGDI